MNIPKESFLFTGKFYKKTKFRFTTENKQDISEANNEIESKYNINIKKTKKADIFGDYFYEYGVDKSKVLPKSNKRDESLLDLPEYRELYKNFSVVVRDDQLNELDDIKHDIVLNDRKYKYGLTAKNEIPFKELVVFNKEDSIPKTSTENLFELLNLDQDSSYESMVLKFRNEYQHEVDMYGDIVKAGEIYPKVFDYGVPIPIELINDIKQMTQIRKYSRYNRDLPGNIEDVHPNKFIADLRPIDEFRHTPVVPISESDIKTYRDKIEEKNRMKVYFEIKKHTLYHYAFGLFFCFILYATFKYVNGESEKLTYEVERIKFRRLRYREEEDIY